MSVSKVKLDLFQSINISRLLAKEGFKHYILQILAKH